MVLRKASDFQHFPTSPNSKHYDTPAWHTSTGHLDVDSADIPPVPSRPSRETPQPPPQSVTYEDAGNPWLEQSQQRQANPEPTRQQPEYGHLQDEPSKRHGVSMVSETRQWDNHTPSSSSESVKSHNFWDDDDDPQYHPRQQQDATECHSPHLQGDSTAEPSGIRRKPVRGTPHGDLEHEGVEGQGILNSNNPYRRETSAERTDLTHKEALPQRARETSQFTHKGKESERSGPSVQELHANDASFNNAYPSSAGATGDYNSPSGQDRTEQPLQPTNPPPSIPHQSITSATRSTLLHTSNGHEHDHNPWTLENTTTTAPPSKSPFQTSPSLVAQYNESLLSRGQDHGVVSLKDELNVLPNAAERGSRESGDLVDFDQEDHVHVDHPTSVRQWQDHKSLDTSLETSNQNYDLPEAVPPAKPPRPAARSFRDQEGNQFEAPEDIPPTKPPRPALVVNSDAAVAKMTEQRNETYQIKHFNWFDHQSGRLRSSSMLTQNQNGPCPLLALVNALILGIGEDSQASLDNALRTREQVTLGLIIATLMDELLSGSGESLPDLDELGGFLTRLHTGMNANPRFADEPENTPNTTGARNSMSSNPQGQRSGEKPGSFEATHDLRLYGSFAVPLVHGWIPALNDPAYKAFARSAQTYEDAQAIQFGEEELEYRLSNGGLSNEEQNVWQDIVAIKQFLRRYPTQLTPYGLEVITEWLLPGQFAIMFRNDHFSTIYKHPNTGKLFTLITDAGYAERAEIIWESLDDDSGGSEFFSGDFMSVSHSAEPQAGATQAATQRRQYLAPHSASDFGALSPQERQEQHDADFAMALQLQEQEEQRMGADRRRTGGSNTSQGQGIPIPLRQRPELVEARPLIPPRTSRNRVNAVNRPADSNAEDAPPAYEEAAKGKPYNPPLGSPHHPSTDPSPGNSTTQLPQTTSATPSAPPPDATSSGPLPRRQQYRRSSAYGDHATRFGPASPSVSRPIGHAYGVGAGSGSANPYGPSGRYARRKGDVAGDRECVVM